MKNKNTLAAMHGIAGIIAFVAIIITTLAVTACPDDNGGGGHKHTWGSWSVTTAATCTTAGSRTRTCTLDSAHTETEAVPIDPNAHDYRYVAGSGKAPTCTEEGIGDEVCSYNQIHERKGVTIAIDPDNHDWDTANPAVTAATETTDGIKTTTCKNNSSHTESEFSGEYATGTAGLEFGTNNDRSFYMVTRGTAAPGTVHIPAYHRPDASSPYAPVTAISAAISGDWNGVTQINGAENITDLYGLSGTTTLTSVSFPKVTTIENETFYGCTALVSVNFPNVTTIKSSGARGTFEGCTALTSADFPNVTTIERRAFYGCTALASVSFPEITVINNEVFYGCTSLATIHLPKLERIVGNAFAGTAITSADFPEMTTLDGGAFDGCTSLTSANFPKLTAIESSTFNSCHKLATANFPNVQTIGYAAFGGVGLIPGDFVPLTLTLGATRPPVLQWMSPFHGSSNRTITLRVPSAAVSSYNDPEWLNNVKVNSSANITITVVGY